MTQKYGVAVTKHGRGTLIMKAVEFVFVVTIDSTGTVNVAAIGKGAIQVDECVGYCPSA